MNVTNRMKLDQAQKYILCFDNVYYLSASQRLTGCNLTTEVSKAQIFAHGFDNQADKLEVWNISLRQLLNSSLVSFEVKDI